MCLWIRIMNKACNSLLCQRSHRLEEAGFLDSFSHDVPEHVALEGEQRQYQQADASQQIVFGVFSGPCARPVLGRRPWASECLLYMRKILIAIVLPGRAQNEPAGGGRARPTGAVSAGRDAVLSNEARNGQPDA